MINFPLKSFQDISIYRKLSLMQTVNWRKVGGGGISVEVHYYHRHLFRQTFCLFATLFLKFSNDFWLLYGFASPFAWGARHVTHCLAFLTIYPSPPPFYKILLKNSQSVCLKKWDVKARKSGRYGGDAYRKPRLL